MWEYELEDYLGAPAYSLFDPYGERSAVGLVKSDAALICKLLNEYLGFVEGEAFSAD